jgi:RNA polymerase sigma-70 factor (ECF subfamily)
MAGGSIDDGLNVEETGALIDRFLRQCDRTSRVLFVRRYWYLDSISALARRANMTESAVKSNLHRTRGRLRRYLEGEGVTVE